VSDFIDIDSRPEVLVSVAGSVELVDDVPTFVPTVAADWVKALRKLVGHPVLLAFTRSKVRTLAQNRYLWGPFYGELLGGFRKIAADAGEACPFRDKDQLHEACKYRFLGVDVVQMPKGKTLEVPASTTRLTTTQFNAYLRAVAEWAALDYQIYIPEPGESTAA
jgi:hypothetical protein